MSVSVGAGSPARPAPARAWRFLRLPLGLAILALVLWRTGAIHRLPDLLRQPWLPLAFVVQAFLGYVVEASRLGLLLRSQQVALPFPRALRICIMAVPFGYVVPGGVGGDVMKVATLAAATPGRGVELAAVVLVDRVVGLASLLIVALAAALAAPSFHAAPAGLRLAASAAALGLVAILVAMRFAWSPAVRQSGLYRWITTRAPLHDAARRALDALFSFRGHIGALALALSITMLGHVLLAGFFVLGARTLIPAAPAGTVVWVSLLALVANVLPLTPGGLGVGEAAFAAAFRLAGYNGGAELLVLWRIGVLPFAVLGALLYALSPAARGRDIGAP